ncbi:hypothetical protein Ais01nite_19810 [Asanoa ishikariensis]|uniref:Uncharacterized protein n=2 Tax=Asanoa ishikariensis TaxID=137265 RepID=A0A1H3UAP5_9ACTN|nr:hypothetical protein Ais01nite_19810 [Asanoa ishikariensis]SDZ59533.1 hypothetical protein SAMN05421684_6892 [Asanoa ishikariensis]
MDLSWRPTSHPIDQPVPKLGGQPVWLDEPFWPVSGQFGIPMTFVGQFPLPGAGLRMTYLFVTQDDLCLATTFEPEGGESALLVQPGGRVPWFVKGVAERTGPTLWRRGDQWTDRIPVELHENPPDRAAIYRHYEKQTLTGVGVFKRAERTSAKQQAAAWADAEAARQWAALKSQQAQWQQALDQQWQALVSNDPDAVLRTLAEAFEDNEAASDAVGVDGDEVSLVVLVPPASQAIPEQMPGRTAAGNLSLKKITQADKADFFKQFVCGQVLVTLREAFAVAPGLRAARVIVLRNDGRDPYGRPDMPCLVAVSVARRALEGVRWRDADAVDILNAAAHEKLMAQKGRSKELSPLDLSYEPDITALINAVDLEELGAST